METLWNLVRSLFRLMLCATPFIFLAIIAGIVAFLIYDSRKKRASRLQTVVTNLSGISLSEFNEVIGLGTDSKYPLTQTIVDVARQLQDLTDGIAAPLQQRTLHRSVKALEAYRQQAAFGELNNIELTRLREEHLQKFDSLINATNALTDAAEKGETETVRQSLYQVAPLLSEVYHQHTAFQNTLAEAGVQFPLPQPVHNLGLTIEQVAKYMIFVKTTDDVLRRCQPSFGYYCSVQESISWMSQWMIPEWRVNLLNTDSSSPQIALHARVGTGYMLAFQGSIASYEKDYPVSEILKSFNHSQRQKIAQTAMLFTDRIASDEYLECGDHITTLLDDLSAVVEELPAHIANGLSSAWTEITASLSETQADVLDSGKATFLAKYIVYTRMLQLVRSGLVNISYASLNAWADFWTAPEFLIDSVINMRDPGVTVLLESAKTEDRYPDYIRDKYKLYPVFRSDIRHFEMNAPIAELVKELQPAQVDLILDLAVRLVELLDPYSSKLLEMDSRNALSEILASSDLRLALPTKDIGVRGIAMLDMGLATRWQAVQLCKVIMCIFVNQAIMRKAITIPGLSSDSKSCARWSAQWLRPHWEMVLSEEIVHQNTADIVIKLYPIHELTRSNEAVYFSGQFLKFVNEFPSAIENEIQRLDPNEVIPDAARWAILHYGNAVDFSMDQDIEHLIGLVAIEPEDQFLTEKTKFNDHVLLALLDKGGLVGNF